MLSQRMLMQPVPLARQPARAFSLDIRAERLRGNNVGPADGARRDKMRKGRGTAAGQGGTCGFGNRGQKSRSGPGVRPGFEGGQTALYRRLPKLRGIAGGMSAGLPDFVVVNLERLNSFSAGEEINLETLKEKGIVRASGRRASLPLKVLGTGKLNAGVKIAAAAFSKSAEEKIKAAGGEAVKLPGKVKWTKKAYKRQVAALKKAGKDYKTEMLKKKVARLVAKGRVNPKRLVAKTKTKPEAASGTGRKVKKTA
ncbi:plastid ribosomal protein L15 [Haematococcus lacustris]